MGLSAAFQPLGSRAIQTALSTKTLGRTLHLLDETSSTNTAAVGLAQGGAPNGTVVVAEVQTAGRGRLGRGWYSPPGQNLYCSVVLRSAPEPDRLSLWLSWIPLLSAVAVARAVQITAGLRPSVKWPNDVLIGARKIGGVLCESGGAGTPGLFVVVGIGLNVNTRRDAFPEDLRDVATSMAAEAGRPFDRAALLAALLLELELRAEAFLSGKSVDAGHEYGVRCSTIGRRIQVTLADGATVEGWADSIAPDGALRIIREGSNAGSVLDVRAGDVVHLR